MKIPFWLPVVLLGMATAVPVRAGDTDDDGIPNKYDLCKKEPEDIDNFEDTDGCPDVDNDKDGVCDAWVAEKGQGEKYAAICKSSDKCAESPEDRDGFQDDDGCPDLDNDKDGIPDAKDRCAADPEDMDGFEDNDGCPDPDNDKDAVCDAWVMEKALGAKFTATCTGSDNCTSASEDKDGFEDDDGCPELDNDKDSIPDLKDKCPGQAENRNGVEDDDGCPDKTQPVLQKVQVFPLVRFRTSTVEMTVEGESALNQFAKQLAEYPDSIVEIRLFTWYKGRKKDDYLKLLKDRSKAVVDYLVGKGVRPSQLREVDYSLDNMNAYKGTERDFNQEAPMEAHLQN